MADSKRATTVGILIVALFLCLLYVLPKLTRQKEYVISAAKQASAPLAQFPLDAKFKIITVGSAKRVAFGKEITVAELLSRQSALIVNFWATWCPPCIEEMPSLEFLNRQLKARSAAGELVIAISVDEKIEDVQTLLKTFEFVPSFVILHDPSGKFAATIGTSKFPETYLVKKGGEIAFKWGGPQDWLSRDVLMQLAKLSLR